MKVFVLFILFFTLTACAWLMDSTNADIFWGLGSLLDNQKKFWEAVLLFKKSIHLNPNNLIVWIPVGQSYGTSLCGLKTNASSTVILGFCPRKYER